MVPFTLTTGHAEISPQMLFFPSVTQVDVCRVHLECRRGVVHMRIQTKWMFLTAYQKRPQLGLKCTVWKYIYSYCDLHAQSLDTFSNTVFRGVRVGSGTPELSHAVLFCVWLNLVHPFDLAFHIYTKETEN